MTLHAFLLPPVRLSRRRRARLLTIAVLLSACAALTLMLAAAPAMALRGHAFGKSFGSPGSGNEQFNEPAGVAVNEATGEVYVVDEGNNRVEVFSGSGAFEGQFDGSGAFEVKGKVESGEAAPAGAFVKPNTVAVDNACVRREQSLGHALTKAECEAFDPSNGDVYVQDGSEQEVIDKFSPTGDFISQVLVPKEGGFLLIKGVATDSRGSLWVAEEQAEPHEGFDKFSNVVANEFEEFVKPPIRGIQFRFGLALDAEEHLYSAAVFQQPSVISKFDDAGKLLNPDVAEEAFANGEPATGVATELPSNNVYVDNQTSIRRFDAKEPPSEVERFGQGHLSVGSGIAVNSTTGQVYVADQSADRVAEFPLEPPGPPTVEHESVSAVTANSASFQAEVNPRGAATEYRFEYGPCASEGACKESPFEKSTPVPDGPVGADFEVHELSTHPQDLTPATAYHFRVVAHNGLGKISGEEVIGEEQVFTTQPAGVFGRLDGRAFEMVSPPQKHGALIQAISQAAAAGNAITYVTDSPTEAQPSGYTNSVQVLASRSASAWSSKDLTLIHEVATGQSIGGGAEYRASSEDLSEGVVQPFGPFVALSTEASEQTAYLQTNYLGGDPSQFCTSNCLRPLVTAGNATSGLPFGEEGLCPSSKHVICGPLFVGTSADLSRIVLSSTTGLTSTEADKGGLYEWSGGSLRLVSVLPSGTPASPASKQTLGNIDVVTRNAISPDGQRVVWSDGKHLYLRKMAEEETIELDKGLSGAPIFQTANAQTTRILFTDEEGGLYLYDSETNERTTLAPAKAGVQGTIAGASEDGSYVYLVANAELSSGEGAVKGNCNGATSNAANKCNLYELHERGGVWGARLVAVLSGEDFPDFRSTLPGLTIRVSSDGRLLAFMSQRSLTGYDNRDASSGKRDEEVYLFYASTGKLTCASCNPTAARPQGVEYAKLKGGLVAGAQVWEDKVWLAANVPGWIPYGNGSALHQSRYLDNTGRLFFNSSDALSPQDVNGTEDVYEYEPPGLGDCSTSSPSYSSRSGGCVGLVSSGTNREESAFLDASETGGDVFFLTSARLAPQDFDIALDVYDAHECTPASPCIPPPPSPPPPCTTEASCKAAPTPQPEIFGAPASATFSGLGNLAPAPSPAKPKPLTNAQKRAKALSTCRAKYRRSKKRRTSCERQARKHYASKAKANPTNRSRA
jgi:DNA-binding beta-propeller fold protein YncE